ncbi:Ribosomal large subunit pseudouridine synthase D [Candidatus Johnevansia muelleri]|uniref:Pseudouridine synthase n=1 Tax=Candidatus Johnevansia muelleri TaxID=1495769 RepID=A0A078KIA3_9GAMM|nr:Ribosomal large subunit pseudouridine synthase D [Candidatus Evansia muelleri]
MLNNIKYKKYIPHFMKGMRLDNAANLLFNKFSRENIKRWIKEGNLTINGIIVKPSYNINYGQLIILSVYLKTIYEFEYKPELIEFNIVYEDKSVIVINKSYGLIVHPACGNITGTLFNALLYYNSNFTKLPRAGIVHRLDKNTTGLILIAKTLNAYISLVNQFKKKYIIREYDAIIIGNITGNGYINAPIDRNPKYRKKQSVIYNGKIAITHYRVIENFNGYTYIKCYLETGRTHQIRVHMNYCKLPLLGDPIYNIKLHKNFKRQALHACRLRFIHPIYYKNISIYAPMPQDMYKLLK